MHVCIKFPSFHPARQLVLIGKKHKRRKLKNGCTDEISLGSVFDQVNFLRAEVRDYRHPAKHWYIKLTDLTFIERVEGALLKGIPCDRKLSTTIA